MVLKISKKLLEAITSNHSSSVKFHFEPGDTIRVFYQVHENNKEKTQIYEGVVLAIKKQELGKNFILRRIVQKIPVEQTFFYNSTNISKIEKVDLKKKFKKRRSKFYFLRNLIK